MAYIIARTGKEPKTHSGTRSEFARLAREDPAIESRFTRFLGSAYELKVWADYDGDEQIGRSEAEAALKLASELVDLIAGRR